MDANAGVQSRRREVGKSRWDECLGGGPGRGRRAPNRARGYDQRCLIVHATERSARNFEVGGRRRRMKGMGPFAGITATPLNSIDLSSLPAPLCGADNGEILLSNY